MKDYWRSVNIGGWAKVGGSKGYGWRQFSLRLTGYLSINFVLVLVNSFGALTAVTGETEMKVCMERTGGCWCCWWLEATSACERVMCLCVVDILIQNWLH